MSVMPMGKPEKLSIAALPTPVIKLESFSQTLGKNIWVKRDDLTGLEYSGNKIRKLEYLFKYALDHQYTTIITCGGQQSNHCRAVAALAAKSGLRAILYLTGKKGDSSNGNLLLDHLFGAELRYFPADQFAQINDTMDAAAKAIAAEGGKAYVIPLGGSNGLGAFGYLDAYQEISTFEASSSVYFDVVSMAVGSGGTYAGLIAGNRANPKPREIVGMSVSAPSEHFVDEIFHICAEMDNTYHTNYNIKREEISINDCYIGPGYGIPTDDTVAIIRELAQKEALVLDPVYTGKAFFGLVSEIKKGTYPSAENFLFIHTGGIFGLFGQSDIFTK